MQIALIFIIVGFLIILSSLVLLILTILIKSPRPKWLKSAWIGLSLFLTAFILRILFFGMWDYDLSLLSRKLLYDQTRFEYHYGPVMRVLYDPCNTFRWIYGARPDEIYVENHTRVVVYNRPAAIIKSRNDSVDVMEDRVKYRGYMGISSRAASFTADPEGVIHENDVSVSH